VFTSISGSLQAIVSTPISLIDGVYTWFFNVFDLFGNSFTTGNFTFTKDTTLPVVSIIYPTNTNYSSVPGELDYTYDKMNMESCWYSTDSGVTNNSIFMLRK